VTIQNATIPSFSTVTLSGGTLKLSVDAMGTGGTVTQASGKVIHTFLYTGTDDQKSYTLNLPNSVSASVLVVAGGGGGGFGRGGAGGAGGLLYYGAEAPLNGHAEGVAFTIPAGDTSVLVGKGGVANANGFASTLGSLNAVGGGYGGALTIEAPGSTAYQGNIGGSGGGSAGLLSSGIHYTTTGGNGTSGQGSKGGDSVKTTTVGGGGGGGGAGGGGANGTNPSSDNGDGGNGGVGLQYSISGAATWYAGGGGGGAYRNNTAGFRGTGGSGIGGDGGGYSGTSLLLATVGAANTGSGGGGGYNGLAGAAGGSGIVIVSYALGPSAINLSSTHIDASASSTLDLAAASGNHTLGNVTVTAGAGANTTLTVDKVNSLTIGTLTIGINGKYYGKLDLGTKGLTLGNGSVTKLKVTTVASTVTTEICVAVAANGSFSALDAQVTDDTGNKWTVAVKNSGTELWLTPPPASGTLILFK
jgi:hypothetical protein